MTGMTKRNPIAKALRTPRFRLRVRPSAKVYARKGRRILNPKLRA
jgi:hypothetical protein